MLTLSAAEALVLPELAVLSIPFLFKDLPEALGFIRDEMFGNFCDSAHKLLADGARIMG